MARMYFLISAAGLALLSLAACSDQDAGWTEITVVPDQQTDQPNAIDPTETSSPREDL